MTLADPAEGAGGGTRVTDAVAAGGVAGGGAGAVVVLHVLHGGQGLDHPVPRRVVPVADPLRRRRTGDSKPVSGRGSRVKGGWPESLPALPPGKILLAVVTVQRTDTRLG